MSRPCRRVPVALLAVAAAAAQAQRAAPDDAAEAAPGGARWEAGLAVGAGWLVDYPRSDQSHTRDLVAPLFIYCGPVLRVDQATSTRPAYAAHAGYLGSDLAATLGRRHSASLSWFVSVRAMALHGAANAASPLLRDKTHFGLGAGVVWTPWQSSERPSD